MKFKISEKKVATSNIRKYYIDWDKPITRGKHWGKRQFEIKQFLKKYWANHIVLEDFIIPRSNGKSLDIVNLTLWQAIEVQGEQHFSYNEFLHRGSRFNYYTQKLRDRQKQEFCGLNNISLIQIFPADEINRKSFISKGIIL